MNLHYIFLIISEDSHILLAVSHADSSEVRVEQAEDELVPADVKEPSEDKTIAETYAPIATDPDALSNA